MRRLAMTGILLIGAAAALWLTAPCGGADAPDGSRRAQAATRPASRHFQSYESPGFYEKYGKDVLRYAWQHVTLTVAAMLIACLIAVPLGIILSHTKHKRLANGVMSAVSIIQPIPSLAFVALTAVAFIYLHLPTIGWPVGLVALVAYALLPMLRNTFTGMRQVDATVIEVARGMGMTPQQILFSVELPLALPVIMTGVRISTVWTIGVATLVAAVGAGGLGVLIFQGLDTNNPDYILAGTIPAVLLALVLDGLLSLLERALVPGGLGQAGSKQ